MGHNNLTCKDPKCEWHGEPAELNLASQNFMQVGQTTACGHCEKRFIEGLKEAEKIGYFKTHKCECICHIKEQAVAEYKAELVSAINKLKEKAHEVDGEAFGYELLEMKDRCCPGDDATAIYEITIDKVLSLISPNKE